MDKGRRTLGAVRHQQGASVSLAIV